MLLLSAILLTASAAPTICIDPGHPSETSVGTRGKHVTEMDVVWKVALNLKPKLIAAGYSVVMTKSRVGEKVTNAKRAEIANANKVALMVRIHCDHAIGHSGFCTIYPDKAGRQGNFMGPPENVLREVQKLAPHFHRAAMGVLNGKLADRGMMRDRQTNVGSKYGALIGSIHSKVPSIVVEVCVLSNSRDEVFVRSPIGIPLIADALLAGVKSTVPIQRAKVAL